MDLVRKLLILFIVIITIIILYFLYVSRRNILFNINAELDTNIKEGLFTASAESEYTSMKTALGSDGPGVSNVDSSKYGKLPLREFCIKASYDSALSGTFVSIDALNFVLSRGCRFIDLEVFFINNAPHVAFTTDSTLTTISAQSPILLSDALKAIVQNAFTGTAPNQRDPLFLQLRIRTNNTELYNMVGVNIHNSLSNHLYAGAVDGSTTYNDVAGKVVLITNKLINQNYLDLANYKGCKGVSTDNTNNNCFILSKFANLESGGSTLDTTTNQILSGQTNKPPIIRDDGSNKTSIVKWSLVEPDTTTENNIQYNQLMMNYGAQIIGFNFNSIAIKNQTPANNLMSYEKFFSDNNAAMVPLSVAIPYLKKQSASG